MAVIMTPIDREKQPLDVSGGAREHRTIEEERTGDRSEHGGASNHFYHNTIQKATLYSPKEYLVRPTKSHFSYDDLYRCNRAK